MDIAGPYPKFPNVLKGKNSTIEGKVIWTGVLAEQLKVMLNAPKILTVPTVTLLAET